MNDQTQNPSINMTPQAPAAQPVPNTPASPQMPANWKSTLSKLSPILKTLFAKFYSKKIIFWPVSIAFGLIFLVIILGLLFGKKSTPQAITKLHSPAPFVQSTPQASASGDILSTSQNKLNDLKKQIDALDIGEIRLQPPTLDFDVKF